MNANRESLWLTEGLRSLTIARIIYCVVAALPLAISLSLWLDPSEPRDAFHEGVLALLVLIVDIPITLVGIIILIRNKIKGEPLLFWSIVTFIASIPLLALFGTGAVADIKTPQ